MPDRDRRPRLDWRFAFRHGIAHALGCRGLVALELALLGDSSLICQGDTYVEGERPAGESPADPLEPDGDLPVEACCPISYCGFAARGLRRVAEVSAYFDLVCESADRRIARRFNEFNAVTWFISFIDQTPRKKMRRLLLVEVRAAIGRKAARPARRPVAS